MRNRVEIDTLSNGNYVTTVTTTDGVVMVENHPDYMGLQDVLNLYGKRKYYIDFGGEWEITLIHDSEKNTFSGSNIKICVTRALDYIRSKDDEGYLYFSYP